jgi:hypothetical protein
MKMIFMHRRFLSKVNARGCFSPLESRIVASFAAGEKTSLYSGPRLFLQPACLSSSVSSSCRHGFMDHHGSDSSINGNNNNKLVHRVINLTTTTSSATSTACRFFASSTATGDFDLDGYYHIEASNALEGVDADGIPTVVYATKLTVTGPDIDGILASMTVALAVRGCSLVSLHAAKSEDTGFRSSSGSIANAKEGANQGDDRIKDVFYVVDRLTGQPFMDDELYDLAESLLESLRKPMAIMGGGLAGLGGPAAAVGGDSGRNSVQKLLDKQPTPPYKTREEQITIILSTGITQ